MLNYILLIEKQDVIRYNSESRKENQVINYFSGRLLRSCMVRVHAW